MRSPETVRNLSARDHFTFKRLADQFDSGIGNIDPKLAKEFFERLGMKHMASDAEHLIKKYGNEELAKRYQRRFKNSEKIKEFEKNHRRYEEIEKEKYIDPARKRIDHSMERLKNNFSQRTVIPD